MTTEEFNRGIATWEELREHGARPVSGLTAFLSPVGKVGNQVIVNNPRVECHLVWLVRMTPEGLLVQRADDQHVLVPRL